MTVSAPTTASTPLDRRSALAVLGGFASSLAIGVGRARASGDLTQECRAALRRLYAESTKAHELGQRAVAVLVFPQIVKAGFMVGAQTGKGVLFLHDRPSGVYRISAGSFGFQAGAQKFGYALFIVTESALDYLKKSQGWAIGSGPSVVIVDKGMARTMNTTTLSQDVYAMSFNQQGLMAGAGLEGSKISRIS
jgi:lipid-binding SYLF domain-containing protein